MRWRGCRPSEAGSLAPGASSELAAAGGGGAGGLASEAERCGDSMGSGRHSPEPALAMSRLSLGSRMSLGPATQNYPHDRAQLEGFPSAAVSPIEESPIERGSGEGTPAPSVPFAASPTPYASCDEGSPTPPPVKVRQSAREDTSAAEPSVADAVAAGGGAAPSPPPPPRPALAEGGDCATPLPERARDQAGEVSAAGALDISVPGGDGAAVLAEDAVEGQGAPSSMQPSHAGGASTATDAAVRGAGAPDLTAPEEQASHDAMLHWGGWRRWCQSDSDSAGSCGSSPLSQVALVIHPIPPELAG